VGLERGNEKKHKDIVVLWVRLLNLIVSISDRLCGLVVRVPGYRSVDTGLDSRALQEKKSIGSVTGSTEPREYN
jgi:hypothetical protein